jgi:DNA-binding NtrC family response regulator
VVPVNMPSLRDRTEDIPLLVHHFLDLARTEGTSRVEGFPDAAMERLMNHHWPGNIRELENLVERVLVLQREGEIDLDMLPPELRNAAARVHEAPRVPPGGIDFNGIVDELEVDLILQALEHTHWNKNRAAQLLGLNRTTLEGKIRKRGLTPPGGASSSS